MKYPNDDLSPQPPRRERHVIGQACHSVE